MDHKEDFGSKTISKITVCHQDNEPQSFVIIFTFEEPRSAETEVSSHPSPAKKDGQLVMAE